MIGIARPRHSVCVPGVSWGSTPRRVPGQRRVRLCTCALVHLSTCGLVHSVYDSADDLDEMWSPAVPPCCPSALSAVEHLPSASALPFPSPFPSLPVAFIPHGIASSPSTTSTTSTTYPKPKTTAPLTPVAKDAPHYIPGTIACAACMGGALILIILWRFWLVYQNRKKDEEVAAMGLTKAEEERRGQELGAQDVTDLKNPFFK
jgi:hypothetical protein